MHIYIVLSEFNLIDHTRRSENKFNVKRTPSQMFLCDCQFGKIVIFTQVTF